MENSRYIPLTIFTEIIDGYTKTEFKGKPLFIKHLSLEEEAKIEKIKFQKYNEGIQRGLISEKDKIEILKKDKLWDDNLESEIIQLDFMLDNLGKTKKNLMLMSDIKRIDEDIARYRKERDSKADYKDEIIGLTCEKYAEKTSGNYYIFFSIYKDEGLTEPFISREEFDEWDDSDIWEIGTVFNRALSLFNDVNIKKTALNSSIQNIYSLSGDNAFHFVGKPVSKFSFFQTSLCSLINYYKFLLSELKDVDDSIKEDPERLENVYIGSQNTKKEMDKYSKGSTMTFGDNGMSNDKSVDSKALAEKDLLKKNGGFDIYEAIKMGL